MSRKEITLKMKDHDKWYGDAAEYWKKVDPSVSGMLQGYEHISDVDVNGSTDFLNQLKAVGILSSDCTRAADCGAGIGRVSKHFLMKHFNTVDIVELCEEFTTNIHNYLNDEKLSTQVGDIYTVGLQKFTPQERYYDTIWIQWVIGHLTDDDFVQFLQRCQKALVPGGCIVIKDNVSKLKPVMDAEDSSVTRTHNDFMSIFKRAGVKLRIRQPQQGFPSQLFTVNMYALT